LVSRIATRSSSTTTPVPITGWTRACLFSPKCYPTDVRRRQPPRASFTNHLVNGDLSILAAVGRARC
jgi:hypothetical protein